MATVVKDGKEQLKDVLYFQHGAIPGMRYDVFLNFVVQFLEKNGDEVVVVQLRWDGVLGECPRGTEEELREVLDAAVRGKDVRVGSLEDMQNLSIQQLRDGKKRLIVLRDVSQASNYTDAASATLTGDPILSQLELMSREPPRGHGVCLLQCQATATNIRDVVVASVLDGDESTSPLLATKAMVDAKILPALRGEVGRRIVKAEGVGLVVVMNDFFEGGTAETAIELCRERLETI